MGIDYRSIDLDGTVVPDAVLELVPETVARRSKILPVAFDGDTLTVAVSDRQAVEGVDRLRFTLNRQVSIVVAPEGAIMAAVERCYARPAAAPSPANGTPADAEAEIDFVEVKGNGQAAEAAAVPGPHSAAVTECVQRMLSEAFRVGAARVLILPAGESVRVAYRIGDAVCLRDDLPPRLLQPLLARLMTMANLHGVIKVFLGGKQRKLHADFKPTDEGLSVLIEIPQDPAALATLKLRAAKLGHKFIDLGETQITADVLATIPETVAREYRVLPVALEGDTLVVALSDPQSPQTIENVRFVVNRPISIVVAAEGAILVALDRHYGQPAAASFDLLRRELDQAPPSAAAGPARAEQVFREIQASPHCLAKPLLEHLREVYRDGMFELFEGVRTAGQLCRQDPVSRHLEVVFPQSELMSSMHAEARQYLEDKIWVLREAIISRLENFLERDPLAQAVAMTYAEYLACRQLAEGHQASTNPATARDAWINFMYCFALRSFPEVESNGALLKLVTEHLAELSAKTASLLDDPAIVAEPKTARPWMARILKQTITDEAIDFDSSPIVHLLELLIAEAFHLRAAAVLLLPWEERIEVAYRIQTAVYPRESLPLRLLYPLLARLTAVAKPSGELVIARGKKKRTIQVRLVVVENGLAAVLGIVPDTAARKACQERAARLGHEFADLEEVEVAAPLLSLVPKAVAWKKVAFPWRIQDNSLTVAVSDVPSGRRLDELRLAFNRPITFALAPEDDILAAISRHYHPATASAAATPLAISLLGRA